MHSHPVFLSLVLVLRNQAQSLQGLLEQVAGVLAPLVSDYELIVVDNASSDDSLAVLKRLTGEQGLPNIQVYALTKAVDPDTAAWVGLENALGDFAVHLNPMTDDVAMLPTLLERAVNGADVVFASNQIKPRRSLAYAAADAVFNRLYGWFSDVRLGDEAPSYRLLSKRVVNFILQHPRPATAYRYLPASAGFARVNLRYSAAPHSAPRQRLTDSVERGVRLLVSTTRAPMRLVTSLSLFGALANVLYSVYVVAIGLFKANVAPGWVSLSLQQSGMFFLISLVLLVLGEYMLNMVSLANEGPAYYVAQEFTSARMTRREKLNIEEAKSRPEPFSLRAVVR